MPDPDAASADRSDAADAAAHAHEARAYLRTARRLHRPRGERFNDVYTAVVSVVVALVMGGALGREVIGDPGFAGATTVPASMLGGLLAGLLATALVAGLHAVGPVHSDRAALRWMLSGDVDRATLLRPRTRRVAALAAALSALGGALAAATSAGAHVQVVALGAGAGALVGLLAAAVLVGRQVRVAGAPDQGRLPDRDLRRGGDLVEAVTWSALTLDPAALETLTSRRRSTLRGGSRRFRGSGAGALIAADLATLPRAAGRIVLRLLVGAAVVLVATALGPLGAAVAVVAVASEVARVAAGSLFVLLRSSGLRRALPVPVPTAKLMLTASPLVSALTAAGVTGALAVATTSLPWWVLPYAAVAGTAGMVRRARLPELRIGPAVASPMGAVQPGLASQVVHGYDLIGLLTLVLLGALVFVPTPEVVAVPVLALAAVLSSRAP